MPTTAADTLTPHTPGGGEGTGWESLAAAAASRQEMSGETLTTDINDRITLHGEDARCVYGRVTH